MNLTRALLPVLIALALSACGPSAKTCPAGTTECGDSCRNLLDDMEHCGACGNACDVRLQCWAGTCLGASNLCGNGKLDRDEVCDDGNNDDADGCSRFCQVEAGFTCSGAPTVCTPICGDGLKVAGEGCDDGATQGGDGCSATCEVEQGYSCTGSPSACGPKCGDGLLIGGEQCDDGNALSDDGCSATCTVETGFTCTGAPSLCTATCGDGVRASVEGCDDGNTFPADGCSATCTVEAGYTCTGSPSACVTACGDGVRAGAEACDDGNTQNGDGCSASCEMEAGFTCSGTPSVCVTFCGDGVRVGGEACDDGNTQNGDGCSSACTLEQGFTCTGTPSVCASTCGDGLRVGLEQCDDGNTAGGDGCSSSCTVETGFTCTGSPSTCVTTCGDGVRGGTEACDDGNAQSGDGCSSTCAVETGFTCTGSPSNCITTCGDGVRAGSEQCDDGNLQSGDGCSATCAVEQGFTCSGTPSACTTTCGDGIRASTEGCDDGNLQGGDGCSSTCTVEAGFTCTGSPSVCAATCGNGAITGTEQCDDGNIVSGDGCSSSCMLETGYTCTGTPSVCNTNCGDGIRAGTETCDDGNSQSGDGCSASCSVEPGYTCSGTPSVCAGTCGDGVRVGAEQCDDGNTTSGDGCSAGCQNEAGHFFEVEPNDNGQATVGGSNFSSANANGPFTASVLIHGAISPAGDDDVFAISNPGSAPVTVRLDVWNPALGVGVSCGNSSSYDTQLRIRNAAGTELAANTDRVTGDYCSGLSYTILAGQTVYAHLIDFGDNSVIGSYLLQLIYPSCGNGVVEPGEQCDDGNTQSGDGCSSTCQFEAVCGNGLVELGEQCDDGNTSSWDGCSSTCVLEPGWTCPGQPSACFSTCGDGVRAGTEQCDDGNTVSGDGCTATCLNEPGHFWEVEPNDNGQATVNGNNFSSANANGPFTGSVLIRAAISPAGDDDGFALYNPLGTPVTVRLDVWDPAKGVGVSCGTGGMDTHLRLRNASATQLAENIDRSGSDYCSGLVYTIPPVTTVYAHLIHYGDSAAIAAYLLEVAFLKCGDGVMDPGETCDDGNTLNGDGCSNLCQVEPGFGCSGQPSVCTIVCGDGIVAGAEQCDDGNTVNGDGCSATCQVEGATAEVEPNDTFAQADANPPSVTLTADALIVGSIQTIGDKDLFRVELSSFQVVRFETFNNFPFDCSAGITTTLRLFDSGGTQIVTDTTSGIRNCSALVMPLDAGVYYIQVEETGNDGVIPSYILQVKFHGDVGNEVEPNETRATATPMPGNHVFIFGDHTLQTDADYFAITVPAGGSLRAEVIEGDRATETCESNGVDSRLTLYGPTGALLTDDDDNGRGYCSTIDGTGSSPQNTGARNLAAGTYYLLVRASSYSQTNPDGQFVYRLVVTIR